MILFLILFGTPIIITSIDFLAFIFTGKQIVNRGLTVIAEIFALLILPLMYGGFGDKNECCGDTAVFSPKHQLSIGILCIFCLAAYFYSSYRKTIATPVIEISVNALLFIGIVLNIFIAIHTEEALLAFLGNLPIIILAILVLVKNQRLLIQHVENAEFIPKNKFEHLAWKILKHNPVIKIPVIFILCLPVLAILAAFLLLAGQKPDSLIRAFTDTYHHGFSQWNYQCDNVNCGGHYLCSVAANGHKNIVKPKRLGLRNGNNIICNRQLLVSNAFEDLVQEKAPFLHKVIRKQYNKVGNLIHRHYHFFNNKFLSDLVYILMKPLEWFFVIVLYSFDKKPENRIAKQYLSNNDRQLIDKAL